MSKVYKYQERLKLLFENVDFTKWYKQTELIEIMVKNKILPTQEEYYSRITAGGIINDFHYRGYLISGNWKDANYEPRYRQEKNCNFYKFSIKGLLELRMTFGIKTIDKVDACYAKLLLQKISWEK